MSHTKENNGEILEIQNQSVSFCYRVSPTRIDTLNPNQLSAPWNPYGPLKFYSPVYNGTPGPLDGNVIAQHLLPHPFNPLVGFRSRQLHNV
jgi:hypothetical protein